MSSSNSNSSDWLSALWNNFFFKRYAPVAPDSKPPIKPDSTNTPESNLNNGLSNRVGGKHKKSQHKGGSKKNNKKQRKSKKSRKNNH